MSVRRDMDIISIKSEIFKIYPDIRQTGAYSRVYKEISEIIKDLGESYTKIEWLSHFITLGTIYRRFGSLCISKYSDDIRDSLDFEGCVNILAALDIEEEI